MDYVFTPRVIMVYGLIGCYSKSYNGSHVLIGVLSVFKCVGTWRYGHFKLRQSKFTYVIRVGNQVRDVSFWILVSYQNLRG